MSSRTYRLVLAGILAAAGAARAGEVLWREAHDPQFARPILDGAYYVEWARELPVEGAYYLAPLYAYFLGGLFRLVGERYALLYAVQHAVVLVAAALLAEVARRRAGEGAGLGAAALLLAYHPVLFFAGKPVAEPVALALLVGGLWELDRARSVKGVAAAGAALGLLGLARPNLLVVPVVWVAGEVVARRRREAAALGLAVAAVLAPATLRNAIASGHLVPVASNAGLTLYHGNGPQASGVYTPPEGLSGEVRTQRDEATALARKRSGRDDLDAVEADRWWGRRAVEVRAADPWGSVRLVGWRAWLLIDSYEHGLDYAPELDPSPWRHVAPVPLGAILALAACGVLGEGFRRAGGWRLWAAAGACALTPLVFYVSSRYRLPMVAMLCLPAGVGAAGLLRPSAWSAMRPQRALGLVVGGALMAASVLVPSRALQRLEEAGSLANLGVTLAAAGDREGAEAVLRSALERDATSTVARYNLGLTLEGLGRLAEAEREIRRALALDPGVADAAEELGRVLLRLGRPDEVVPILRQVVDRDPGRVAAWRLLVAAHRAAGAAEAAAEVATEAAGHGIAVEGEGEAGRGEVR